MFAISAYADYLWWTFQDDPTVNYTFDGQTYQTKTDDFYLRSGDDRLEVTDIRVHVTGANTDEYLNIVGFGGGDPDVSVYFETLPISNQGEYFYAFDVAPYVGGAYNFIIEIGNWSEPLTDENWTVMGEHYIPGNEIASHIAEGMTEAPDNGWYTVTQFNAVGGAVPEPTSGMLVLIGGALLMLRRRNRGEAAAA